MKRVIKYLSLLLLVTFSLFTLVGCNNSDSFYKEWYEAGATIEKDNVFELITVDDVVKKRDAKESFIVFLGSSTLSNAVSEVTGIQYDADNLNYDGKVYFVNTKNIIEKATKREEVNQKLKINLEKVSGLAAICYNEGVLSFETTKASNYRECERFIFEGSDAVSIRAVAIYAFEFYPVNK